MSFFEQTQEYFAFFSLFGLWSSWPKSEYKLLLRISAAISVVSIFVIFTVAIWIGGFQASTALPNIVSNVLFLLLFVTHFVILLESFWKTESQLKLINMLSAIDHMFYAKFGIAVPYRSEKCKIFIRLFSLGLIEVIIKLFIVLLIWMNLGDGTVLFTVYSNFVICLRLIQIIFFMNLLQNRLIWFHDELTEMLNPSAPNSNCIHEIANFKNKTIPFVRNVFAKRSTYDRLTGLKQIYSHLFEACVQIDNAFGWSLLLTVIFIFATVTFEVYWAYISLENTFLVLISISFSAPIVIIFGVLTRNCSSCSQLVRMIKNRLLFK